MKFKDFSKASELAPGVERRVLLVGALLLALATGGYGLLRPSLSANGGQRVQAASALAQQVHARCVQEMLRSTCVAMKEAPGQSAASRVATPSGLVFIAGLGPVDAQAYQQIRQAGQAMCSVALRACDADPQSGACRTAQSLWRSQGAVQAL